MKSIWPFLKSQLGRGWNKWKLSFSEVLKFIQIQNISVLEFSIPWLSIFIIAEWKKSSCMWKTIEACIWKTISQTILIWFKQLFWNLQLENAHVKNAMFFTKFEKVYFRSQKKSFLREKLIHFECTFLQHGFSIFRQKRGLVELTIYSIFQWCKLGRKM